MFFKRRLFSYLIFIGCLLSIFFGNRLFAILLLVIISLLNKELIWPIMLIMPVIEGIKLYSEGITISKLYFAFLIILLLCNVFLKKHSFLISDEIMLLIMLVCIIFITHTIFNSNKGELLDVDLVILNENLSFITLMFFSMLLATFIINNKETWAQIHLSIIKYIPIGIIICCFYIIYNPANVFNYYGITRYSLQNVDPNELSALLVTLGLIALYNYLYSGSFVNILINLSSLLLILYVILTVTLSKTGLIIFIIMNIVSLIYFLNKLDDKQIKKILFAKGIVIVISIVSIVSFTNINPIKGRFAYYGNYINKLDAITTGRLESWVEGFNIIIKNPLYGTGPSDYFEKSKYEDLINKTTVSHNMFISLAIQYGVFSLIIFIILCIKTIRAGLLQSSRIANILSLMFICLIINGFSLSWFKREIIWIILGIILGLVSLSRKKYQPKYISE